ncbi:MAG: bifunctional [glutamate--ammonia ligase]-adenylyl-L-tyrosine phosphorylase/[glutamate--ammonia-ligase] adenylyltransferase [Gammaproteobacteria bacterium]|nr:bifunctional [glutamate--ammonia ligase]-adenylyl-L-tyrosine phosphorylase/[glutamate--ammonia-ligase] adenylyltransferase [Gammaproteobacteria bacterium]
MPISPPRSNPFSDDISDLVQQWQELVDNGLEIEPGDWQGSLERVWSCSDFAARLCLRIPQLLVDLHTSGDLYRPYDLHEFRQSLSGLANFDGTEPELKRELRLRRQREMLRIAWRDLAGWTDLQEVITTTSALADGLISAATTWVQSELTGKHGQPREQMTGEPAQFVVLAMGKLGGDELNFSSDIDLIFCYSDDGETEPTNDSQRQLSNHEYFVRLGQRLIQLLDDATADGFVFRVDMRLRPNGKSGPLAISFDAAENYYQSHGREWERYAMIKARSCLNNTAGEELLAILKPFVYRRYLDYGALEAIRSLKADINAELKRRNLENSIKLGAGGIREIEFIAQAFQLIRGGREPMLQQRRLLPVLQRLGTDNVLIPNAVEELQQAYVFLRNSEHRLQMYQDKQTHSLPDDEAGQHRLAYAMGFDSYEDYLKQLNLHRRRVHGHFSQVFTAPQEEESADDSHGMAAVWMNKLDEAPAMAMLEQQGFHEDPQSVLHMVNGFRNGHSYQAFSAAGRKRVDRLMPLLLNAAALAPHPEVTFSRLIRLLESIGRRSAYLSLMFENPMVLSQLVKLCAASPWISEWIASRPLLLDELITPMDAFQPRQRGTMLAELAGLVSVADSDDLERQMEILREYVNRRVLQVAAADIGPGLPATEVGRQLTSIAEVMIEYSLALALQALEQRHGSPVCSYPDHNSRPGFAVIGYGKLGSVELGYGSDVDVVFLYDDCDGASQAETDGERCVANETFFARVGQRLIHILTTRMTGGILYEVDMRLRPSGSSGPLAAGLVAFERYQAEKAWTWEHQALVRARPVAGDRGVAGKFAEIRRRILCRQRDPDELASEVADMRNKMLASQKPHEPGLFDVKHDRGGIVDIEFMVQYWVLRWARTYPALIEHTDNIAILEALAAAGLLDSSQTGLLGEAYSYYLSVVYRLKLMQTGPYVDVASLGANPERVAAVWNSLFSATAD